MQGITSLTQFNKLKANPLLIIDFYAVWCGPCKAISPGFEKLAVQYASSPSIVFAKVDVDKVKDVSKLCGITAMPTFQFFKDGKKVDEVRGADVQQLNTKIGYYTAEAIKAGETKANPTKSTGAPTVSSSLRSLINLDGSKLLNASLLSSVRNVASPPPKGYAVASTSGAQLLIHLIFTHSVSPTYLKFTVPKDSLSNAPSRVLVGTNVPVQTTTSKEGVESTDLDMDSLNEAENTQSINIYSDEYVNGTAELKLKPSKFAGIDRLTIRIDANLSGVVTTISKIGEIDIIGSKP